MSVISKRSAATTPSILKPSLFGTPKQTDRRVRFRLPSDVKKILLDYKNGVSSKEYEELVCTLRDSEICDSELLKLLQASKGCIAFLNYELRLFVQVLIIINWTTRSEAVVEVYREFIHDIVSAHAHHTKTIIDQLVKLFLSPVDETDVEEWTNGLPSDICMNQFNNVHYILRSILKIRPMSEDLLMSALVSSFPYYKIKPHKQESYFYNLLQILKYKPELRTEILQLLIDKIIYLDANASREDIQIVEEEGEDIFNMEVDDEENKTKKQMKHPIGNILDIVMRTLFIFISNECYDHEKQNLNLANIKTLYNDFLSVFENSLLTTHALHHVQFLMFYLLSMKNTVAENFLQFLWKKVLSPVCPPVVRKNSVAYLASFLARAKFLSLGCLKQYLNDMSTWIHNYITRNENSQNCNFDVNHHAVFYYVCQALFYLIAFRHKDLVDSRKKLAFLQSLNLSKIVTSQLNPLRVCQPAVVQNFAAVTRTYQLVYCYTIIEKNARSCLPVLTRSRGSSTFTNVQLLDMYFPFDPYVLLRTSVYIQPLYREYESSLVNEQKLDTLEKEMVEDEDDFIPETNVKPCCELACSTSPGFKQKLSL